MRLLKTIGRVDFTGQECAALNKLTMPPGGYETGSSMSRQLAEVSPTPSWTSTRRTVSPYTRIENTTTAYVHASK